jgi:signal transduction histidine kinase/ActR/RegA family two-component response regulator
MLNRRRWHSIDRKLPLLASGLVLLTVATLGWSAYLLFEHVLLDRAAQRLAASARIVSQVIVRPRLRDATTVVVDRTLIAFLRGRASRDDAQRALAHAQQLRDTMNFHSALLDTTGRITVDSHRGAMPEPAWAGEAIARHALRGHGIVMGPIESVSGTPVLSGAYALYDSTRADSAVVGYVAQSWAIASGRNARFIREMIGVGVTMVLGQPGAGAWTDLEHIVAAPPAHALADTVVDVDGSLAASWPVPGTPWVVWLSQSKRDILTPTRTLLWTMFPLGLAIAVAGAALMWRIARRITHPIVQLTEAVEGVATDTGLPRTREMPSIQHHDEVARLRVAFERMALRLADREALELQLRHAQKMEAIGRLAGGIAHDFNNLLTAIRSYADLMIDDMPEWDTRRADVQEIRKAAQRATELTAQLLAFSRKQMLQPRVLDTAAVLHDLQPMLRRLLIEDIELVVDAQPHLWPVRADRGQLEQVVVNLAVNARDAMPDGGVLLIRAWNHTILAPMESKHGVVPAGEFVAIAVSDTGTGMDDDTQSRAFEPFFTTKDVGKGTGLGLATVHGIVAQSGGHVTLESHIGAGTIFTTYLPRERHASAPQRNSGASSRDAAVLRTDTILLVEDEPAVRGLARRVLTRAGFRVLDAATPHEAIRLATEHGKDIALVLSDVVMPQMSGPQLVERLKDICPHARVLYVSGYTNDEVIGRGLANAATALLQKPFSAQQLVERVRDVIDTVNAS